MKSAIELAMEKTEELVDNQNKLSEEQLAAISDIRNEYEAKWAEQEIALKQRLAKLAQEADPQGFAEHQRQLQEEMNQVRDRIFSERGREDRGGARAGIRLSCPNRRERGRRVVIHRRFAGGPEKGLPNRGVFSKAALPLAAAALAAIAGCGSNAVSPGDRAPAFTLPAADGTTVSLFGLLDNRAAAVLVFYRGFF